MQTINPIGFRTASLQSYVISELNEFVSYVFSTPRKVSKDRRTVRHVYVDGNYIIDDKLAHPSQCTSGEMVTQVHHFKFKRHHGARTATSAL